MVQSGAERQDLGLAQALHLPKCRDRIAPWGHKNTLSFDIFVNSCQVSSLRKYSCFLWHKDCFCICSMFSFGVAKNSVPHNRWPQDRCTCSNSKVGKQSSKNPHQLTYLCVTWGISEQKEVDVKVCLFYLDVLCTRHFIPYLFKDFSHRPDLVGDEWMFS